MKKIAINVTNEKSKIFQLVGGYLTMSTYRLMSTIYYIAQKTNKTEYKYETAVELNAGIKTNNFIF